MLLKISYAFAVNLLLLQKFFVNCIEFESDFHLLKGNRMLSTAFSPSCRKIQYWLPTFCTYQMVFLVNCHLFPLPLCFRVILLADNCAFPLPFSPHI